MCSRECEKQFNEKATLNSHIELHHTSEYEFFCNLCDYKTRTKMNLKYHTESKHDGVEYACDKCTYKTGTSEAQS